MTNRSTNINNNIYKGDLIYKTDNPIIIEWSDNCTLRDTNQQYYLDLEAANGTSGLGYNKDILACAYDDLCNLSALPSFLESPVRLEVADKLSNLIHQSFHQKGKISFDLGGAQGIELAYKIACYNQTIKRIVVFSHAYHGRSSLTCQLSSSQRYQNNLLQNISVIRLPMVDRYAICPGTLPLETGLQYLRTLFSEECTGLLNSAQEPTTTLADCLVIVEPVLNVGGMIYPNSDYLNYALENFKARGALICYDEVCTGLYRTGQTFGAEKFSVCPDILVLSKALCNGLAPLSCVWAKDPLLDTSNFPPGSHSTTYGNNPLSFFLAKQTLAAYNHYPICERIAILEEKLSSILHELAERYPLIESVAISGVTARIVLKNPIAPDLCVAARHLGKQKSVPPYQGLLLSATQLSKSVLCFHPAFTMTDTDLQAMHCLLHELFSRFK